jgi:hypothetical protein
MGAMGTRAAREKEPGLEQAASAVFGSAGCRVILSGNHWAESNQLLHCRTSVSGHDYR